MSGVVEGCEVGEPRVDARGLVVGHDEQRDGGLPVSTGHWARTEPRPESHQRRIAHEGICEKQDGGPEENLGDPVHVTVTLRSPRSDPQFSEPPGSDGEIP